MNDLGLVMLGDGEMNDLRKRIIEHDGDIDKAGISLDTMCNAIYTRRMKANTMQDTPTAEKAPRAKAEKTPARVVATGIDIDAFLK